MSSIPGRGWGPGAFDCAWWGAGKGCTAIIAGIAEIKHGSLRESWRGEDLGSRVSWKWSVNEVLSSGNLRIQEGKCRPRSREIGVVGGFRRVDTELGSA